MRSTIGLVQASGKKQLSTPRTNIERFLGTEQRYAQLNKWGRGSDLTSGQGGGVSFKKGKMIWWLLVF